MAAQRRKEEINLVPESGFESTTTGRVLAWILSTFRVIVIVTEFIVMIAFLSRFWLDAQNSDLNEKIEQKQAVLAASTTFERQFKNTQTRLKIYSEHANQSDPSILLEQIVLSLPPDVLLTDISINADQVEVSGNTPNERSIQQLVVNLNSTENLSNFTITKISSNIDNETSLDFTLTGESI